MSHEERMAAFEEADLYVVITEAFCAGRPALEVLTRTLEAGVRLVQLREKDLDGRRLYLRALDFRRMTAAAGALLIVNDRVDIAMAVDADGVHVGQDDMPVSAVRRIAPQLIVGVSTHSLDEALAAQEAGASYVNIGPIFATQTKSTPIAPLGLEAIDKIAPQLRIPWTTMGGIKSSNIAAVVSWGARHPAVMTAVTAAANPAAAARGLREEIKSARPQLKVLRHTGGTP
jgi:thiamine-phosphate pyrophosphorylase